MIICEPIVTIPIHLVPSDNVAATPPCLYTQLGQAMIKVMMRPFN